MTLATTPEQEAEKRAQNCRAKAAYCKWLASITADRCDSDQRGTRGEVDMFYWQLKPFLDVIEGLWTLAALVMLVLMVVKLIVARWQGKIWW